MSGGAVALMQDQATADGAQLTMLQNEDDCVRGEGAHVRLPRNEQAAPFRRANLVRPFPRQRAKTPPAPAVHCTVFFLSYEQGVAQG